MLHALEGLEYGSVNITIHDAQITQIDRIEKQRFPLAPSLEKTKPSSKVSRR
ncbi:YezD family protein [Alicyclobacillus pomorum]|uniref:YezD family protein n=1 Tax=Alicyclobacillus pomorum TaxID=204470 RepID=UPI003CCBB14B